MELATLPKEMVLVSNARAALEQAKSIDEVKDIRDKAEAVRMYLKQAGESLEVQNAAAEVKLRAERKAGEILATKVRPGNPQLLRDETIGLDDIGVSRIQSHRWQKIASVSDESFESHIEAVREAGKELTTASVLRLVRNEPEPEEPWSLHIALEKLGDAVRKVAAKWPEDHIEVMAHKLRSLGDEILTNGGLAE